MCGYDLKFFGSEMFWILDFFIFWNICIYIIRYTGDGTHINMKFIYISYTSEGNFFVWNNLLKKSHSCKSKT
jgi:phosphate starvation-inducible membrane PsiE